MDTSSGILERQVADLKHGLKSWEKSFAAANGGRKPGRDDIRNDATVSAKYREYDRLRRPTSLAKPVETPRKQRQQGRLGSAHKWTALRERSGNAASATPNKAAKSVTSLDVVEEEQEQEIEATPAFIRCALGPTPQKDGLVLGIFDMPSATPSKTPSVPAVTEAVTVRGTPSKTSAAPTSSAPLLSATPQSSSRRRFLDAFAGTPSKRKREDDVRTPSTAKRQFATPSFLRRNLSLAPIEEESTAGAPPFKKRGLVRSLSSIIQGLRKQEEKRMDDDWDIMNEMEVEEDGEAPQPAAPKVLVEETQAADMPLGPDKAAQETDGEGSSDAEALDANGRVRKPWKKKGLKRQTKRTKMRPVLHKPKKAGDLAAEDGSEDEVVAETQQLDMPEQLGGKDGSALSDDDDGASNYEDETAEAGTNVGGAPKKAKKKRSKLGELANASKVAEDEAPQKKARKKVSAQAHPNFRALKIKNKNSKASGKGGRRFGRR